MAAAAIAGADEVYRIGGAQAIGALAHGTESLRPVDVIVGPGNVYVSQAKRQVTGLVGVPAAFAGPSEVVVIGDDTVPAELCAIDIVVQAEHGPGGLAWLITWSEAVADTVDAAIASIVAGAERRADIEATLADGGYTVLVDGPEQAVAVANAIAPEHLQLMTADPAALVPLVRNAGAVFCGPWSPASLGDYAAGPSHVLPTFGSARYAGALSVLDFLKQIHVVTADETGLARLGPVVETLATAEGLPVHAASIAARRSVAAMTATRVQPRGDLALMAGYHSPQLDVPVRLNTNESPVGPPEAWVDELAAALADVAWNRYPDREAVALRSALADHHATTLDRVFCANGSNEVLQSVLLAYGGAGRTAATFEPTYAVHSHLARVTGTGVIAGGAGRGLRPRPRRGRPGAGRGPGAWCSSARPTTRPGSSPTPDLVASVADRCAAAGALLVVDEAYGQFAVVDRAGPGRRRPAAARHPDLLQDLGHGRRPARLRDRPGLGRRRAGQGRPAVPPRRRHPAGRPPGPRPHRRHGRAGPPHRQPSGSAWWRASAGLPLQQWPSGANFVLFRPDAAGGDAVWQALVERGVLVRNCASWPRLTGLPPGHRRHARRERALPDRPRGDPVSAPRTATVERTTAETSIELTVDLDGTGAVDVETGLPFFDHMLSPARTPRRPRPARSGPQGDLEIDAHHTVEDVGIALGGALKEALGDKAGVRRFASSAVPLDEALVEAALDLSGRPFLVYEIDPPGEKILGDPPFDPQLAEEFWRALVTAAGWTLHLTMVRGKNTHHVIEASFKATARALRDAVRLEGSGIPSTKGTL